MNPSRLLKRLKRELGITFFTLPFENPDEEFMEIIKDTTIPVYSQFYPFVEDVIIDLDNVDMVYNTYEEGLFIIPPSIIQDRELYYVVDVQPFNTTFTGNYYPASSLINNTPSIYEDMMLGQASADLLSGIAPVFTWQFMEPNKLKVFNLSSWSTQLKLTIGVEHYANLSSIKKGQSESFYKLAKLDIKMFLFNNLRMLDKMETALGTIDLHIEDWANAESERDALIEKMTEQHNLSTYNSVTYR